VRLPHILSAPYHLLNSSWIVVKAITGYPTSHNTIVLKSKAARKI